MTGTMLKRRVGVVILAAGLLILVLSLAFSFVNLPPGPEPFPPWEGMGDWEACAEQVPLGPVDAIRIAAGFRNITMAELGENWRVFVRAAYVNETGYQLGVDCETLMPNSTEINGRYHSFIEGPETLGWDVTFSWAGGYLTLHRQVVEWQSGEILGWASGT